MTLSKVTGTWVNRIKVRLFALENRPGKVPEVRVPFSRTSTLEGSRVLMAKEGPAGEGCGATHRANHKEVVVNEGGFVE